MVLKPRDPEDSDALSRALRMLVPLGLRVEASVVRDRLGSPDPPEGAEVLQAPAPARGPAPARARAGQPTPAAGLLEELQARALDDWQRQIGPLLDPVRELVATTTSWTGWRVPWATWTTPPWSITSPLSP